MLSTLKTVKEDPRITRTRNLILGAFMDILPEKGFQAASVQDITEKAGINRATFYAHFPDKYALLDYSIQQAFRNEIEKRVLNACEFSIGNLQLLIVVVCEFVSTTNSHCSPPQPQFEALVETQVKGQLQELLEKWIEQIGLDLDSNIAATAASWAIYGLALHWSHDKSKKKPSAEEYAKQVFPLISANLKLMQPA